MIHDPSSQQSEAQERKKKCCAIFLPPDTGRPVGHPGVYVCVLCVFSLLAAPYIDVQMGWFCFYLEQPLSLPPFTESHFSLVALPLISRTAITYLFTV